MKVPSSSKGTTARASVVPLGAIDPDWVGAADILVRLAEVAREPFARLWVECNSGGKPTLTDELASTFVLFDQERLVELVECTLDLLPTLDELRRVRKKNADVFGVLKRIIEAKESVGAAASGWIWVLACIAYKVLPRLTPAIRAMLDEARPKSSSDATAEMSLEWRAIATAEQHPDWTNQQIADALGIARETLSRMDRFKLARKLTRVGAKSRLLARGVEKRNGASTADQ